MSTKDKDKDIEIIDHDHEKAEILMQSRQLVHTSYEITAVQNRLFYYFLLKAQKEKNGQMTCEVHIDEIRKLIQNNDQSTLESIKKMINVLQETRIFFEYYKEGEKVESDYVLVAGFDYHTENQVFTITLIPKVYKRLLDYTIYAPLNLDILTKFKSFYSQRLYELLRLWSRTDVVIVKKFKLSQIRFILGVENKYPAYKNFKQRVLNQALKEINELGNMQVKILDEIKVKRKVEEIEFEILDFEKKKYFKDLVQEVIPPPDDEETKDKDNKNEEANEEAKEETNTDKDFYVPNEAFFTEKTLDNLKVDFYNIDFKDTKMKKLLESAIFSTLEYTSSKDSVTSTKIVQKNYNYFKTTLLNKIKDFKDGKYSSDIPKVKTRFHNIGKSFDDYDPDELERNLKESQRIKEEERKALLEEEEIKPTISEGLINHLVNKYIYVLKGKDFFQDEYIYSYTFNTLKDSFKEKTIDDVLKFANDYEIEFELDSSINQYICKTEFNINNN